MIDRSALAADACLDSIVTVIVDAVSPSRVILFGSRARGDAAEDSDYDLAIEFAFEFTDYRGMRSRLWRLIAAAVPHAPVDLILRQPGQIDEQRDDPGYLDWDIAREGVIVYGRDLQGPPSVVREPRPFASVAMWLGRADEDRTAIDNILAAGPNASWTALCFHSQQLAEKYLKVLIVEAGEHPRRTHDLAELVARARGLGYELPELTDACEALKGFGVEVRYPEDVEIPSEPRARDAWSAACRIVDAVRTARGA